MTNPLPELEDADLPATFTPEPAAGHQIASAEPVKPLPRVKGGSGAAAGPLMSAVTIIPGFYMPDGTPLKVTLSREAILHDFFGRDGYFMPDTAHNAAVLLWFASRTDKSEWEYPIRNDEGRHVPFYTAVNAVRSAALEWIDQFPGSVLDLKVLAFALWNHHTGAAIERDDANDPHQKKSTEPSGNPSPGPSINTPGF